MNPILFRFCSVCAAFVRSVPRIVAQPSVFAEQPRKSKARRYFENIYLRFRDGGVCSSYNGIGLDLKGHDISEYVSNTEWLRIVRGTLAQRSGGYNVVFLDKYLFFEYLDSHGIPTVPIFAHTIGKQCFFGSVKCSSQELVRHCLSLESFFIKKADDMCGRQIMKIVVSNGRFLSGGRAVTLEEIFDDENGRYIFQPMVSNHEEIKAFNPSTLNTLRIVTYRDKSSGEIRFWNGGTIRIGRPGCSVDNYAQGGVCVGVQDNGILREIGFCHDEHLCFMKVIEHPDSGKKFKNFILPYYAECIKLVKNAHKLFPTIVSVGWDVAITQNGPALLEGNHDWDLEFLEVSHTNCYRKLFDEVFR